MAYVKFTDLLSYLQALNGTYFDVSYRK